MPRLPHLTFAAAAIAAVLGAGTLVPPPRPAASPQTASTPPAVEQPEPRATIIFGGDMLFDRSIRVAADEKGGDYIFSCIDPVLRAADVVVANLEGPIVATSSKSVGSAVGGEGNYTFVFPTSTAQLLYRHNIRIVGIGNNHIFNFGLSGVISTEGHLDAAHVAHFGDPDKPEAERVARLEIRGLPFSFVNWSDWTSDPGTTSSQGSDGYGAGKTNPVVEQVRKEAQNGRIVVVYAHWGDEYVPPPERVKTLARSFADAGAALVVGSHPHIVQEHEVYHRSTQLTAGGVDIYYSLGNFIFDQYWNESVRTGLLLKVSFTGTGVAHIEEIPVHLERDRRTCPL